MIYNTVQAPKMFVRLWLHKCVSVVKKMANLMIVSLVEESKMLGTSDSLQYFT